MSIAIPMLRMKDSFKQTNQGHVNQTKTPKQPSLQKIKNKINTTRSFKLGKQKMEENEFKWQRSKYIEIQKDNRL